MCGIAGLFAERASETDVDRMLGAIVHRGPDEFGTYADDRVAMGTARLSIIDIAHGHQPIRDEASGAVIAFNGEIFNYLELREQLVAQGHSFKTHSDTEVVLNLYLRHGSSFAEHLNGQFAVAIWDPRSKKLLLVRDRFGICPLFYFQGPRTLVFASELKALLATQRVPRAFNRRALDQIFTFWTTVPGHTLLEEVKELLPGHLLEYSEGSGVRVTPFWKWPFPELQDHLSDDFETLKDRFLDELNKAVKLRLRADIEVGSYLSGGIDSSAIVALAAKAQGAGLTTYSVGFKDESYDETVFQKLVSEKVGTKHFHLMCDYADVDRFFEQVVWHAENTLFRTAPSPMYYLSKSVHGHSRKVVLTGEGADEILLGYDIFREVKVRRFWQRAPDSTARPELFKKLYAYLPQFSNPRYASLAIQSFKGTLNSDSPFYSHLIRWNNNAANKVYFSESMKESLKGYDAVSDLEATLPREFFQVGDVDKAQYLELTTLLRGYLLSSQGDRMLMANSVEGRFPFLDHEFVSFANKVPMRHKLRGLKDKFILRESFKDLLPDEIRHRPKFAYQAPEVRAFCRADKSRSELVARFLEGDFAKSTGIFDPRLLMNLIKKVELSDLSRLGTRDNMAFIQMLSTHIFYDQFINGHRPASSESTVSPERFTTRLRFQKAAR